MKKEYPRSKIFNKKVIFVTGGTGSFGKYFVREVLKDNPKKIIIFSRDEDKQYSMQFEYRKNDGKIEFVIGDVRSKESLREAVRGAGIDIFVHAAALKQIPSTEYNIIEAVKTNVLGAQNVTEVSIEEGIPKVIGITTDKVVEPVNAYGMTKALQEKIFILANKKARSGKTRFACVRYGNVVNSRGSVIPLFKKQIESGGPVTVTHSDMTRFILTLEGAISLVKTAILKMKGGEVFVPKIKPLKITDLAETMITFMKSNVKMKVIGIRPGEKIHETLISASEWAYTSDLGKFYIIAPQIDLKGVGFSYKKTTKKSPVISRYSSDQEPFLSKKEITEVLKSEEII
jgi:UDP-N-acetylglucosamine 4,6-dehydratase